MIKNVSLANIILLIISIIGVFICYGIIPYVNQSTFAIYAYSLIISLCLSVYYQWISSTGKHLFLFYLSVFVLGFLMALRAQTGIDDAVYKEIFERVSDLSILEYFTTSGVEKGYLLVNYLLHHLTGGNYNITQAFISFGTFFLWGVAIKEQGVYNISIPVILLFIWSHYYFFVQSAGLVRIFIAIPIVWYALSFVWKGDWKKFVIWIGIASFFHLSSLIMLVFIAFFWKDGYFFRHWFLYLILCGIIIGFSFLAIAHFLVPLLGERYLQYAETKAFSFSLRSFDTFPILIIAVYYLHTRMNKVLLIERKRYIVAIVLISLSIVFSVMSSMVPLGRMMFYANLGILMVSSSILGSFRRKLEDVLLILLFVAYALVYVMHTTLLNPIQADTLFPYYSFL